MKYDLKINIGSGIYLAAVQEIPVKGDKFPTVILVPGFGIDLHEYGYFDDLTDWLVKAGFQAFRFSFAGTGSSQGDFVRVTVEYQAAQLNRIIDYVSKDRFTDPAKIGILAHSFGGVTTISALPLANISTFVFTSVSVDPFTSLSKYFKRQRGFNPEGISQIKRSDGRKTKVGSQIWPSLRKLSLVNKLKELTAPVLFIQGGSDRIVKAYEAEELFNQTTSTKKKLVIIEKANHGFTREFRPKVIELVVSWFNEHL